MSPEFSPISRAFGRAAGFYDAHAVLQRYVLELCVELVLRDGLNPLRLLDVGCGTGRLSVVAKERCLPWQIVSTDLTFPMCRQVAAQFPHVVNADAQALPFADASFDAVISSLTLQWVQNLPLALSEMARVLRPGGVAALSIFGPKTLSELKYAFAQVDQLPRVNRFLPCEQLRQAVTQSGFTIESERVQQDRSLYAKPMDLLLQLKAIGATALTNPESKRGLLTPHLLGKMLDAYRRSFTEGESVYATWEVITLHLRKAR